MSFDKDPSGGSISASESGKKTYSAPKIRLYSAPTIHEYGTLRDLTMHVNFGGINDNGQGVGHDHTSP
jgi:hypothetical protein